MCSAGESHLSCSVQQAHGLTPKVSYVTGKRARLVDLQYLLQRAQSALSQLLHCLVDIMQPSLAL